MKCMFAKACTVSYYFFDNNVYAALLVQIVVQDS